MKSIWTVSVVSLKRARSTRAWGWFSDESTATDFVEDSPRFLAESGYYTHVVVEEVQEGLDFQQRKEIWFELRKLGPEEEFEAVKCEKPESLKHVVLFSLG